MAPGKLKIFKPISKALKKCFKRNIKLTFVSPESPAGSAPSAIVITSQDLTVEKSSISPNQNAQDQFKTGKALITPFQHRPDNDSFNSTSSTLKQNEFDEENQPNEDTEEENEESLYSSESEWQVEENEEEPQGISENVQNQGRQTSINLIQSQSNRPQNLEAVCISLVQSYNLSASKSLNIENNRDNLNYNIKIDVAEDAPVSASIIYDRDYYRALRENLARNIQLQKQRQLQKQ